MLHVVLALAAPLISVGTPSSSVGTQTTSSDLRNAGDILRQFKYDLLTAEPNPNEPPDPPEFEAMVAAGTATPYCFPVNPHTFGGPPSLTFTGSLDLSLNTFGLKTTALPPISASFGMFTYGIGSFPHVPFANGFLCVNPVAGFAHMRMQPLTATGIVVNSKATTPLEYTPFTAGSHWYFQMWYRNAQAGGAKFNLTNGLDVVFSSP